MEKVFTVKEIRNFLESHTGLKTALADLSEQSIIDAIPLTDFSSLNYEKSDENLELYEAQIGMTKEKTHQRTLYRNTDGKKGRYWMACSPKWIDPDDDRRKTTEFHIGYWVNYGDDETYGWFTVEQIREWFNTPSIKLYELGGIRERIRD